ncbi:MAG: GNAT family N-acetyltransferase [Defluviitaleaceae bacterium]|nr:GNAT family N-acetyltransferase [Defluviitaleaceae bacterium]
MKLERYTDSSLFMNNTYDVLYEHEAQNISIINDIRLDSEFSVSALSKTFAVKGWEDDSGILGKLNDIICKDPERLLATVNDNCGSILLTAYCTYPYSRLTLFATNNKPDHAAVKLLADELRSIGYKLPTIKAEHSLARSFAKAYGSEFTTHASLCAMRLDKVQESPKASGFSRPIEKRDLHFAPYWKMECLRECNQSQMPLDALHHAYSHTIDDASRYLWEDCGPVSQANICESTENGSSIGDVYTPPFYRGKGYATSLVAELSQVVLDRGKLFCTLLADASNPTSCGIYRKIGYYDICTIDEIKFNQFAHFHTKGV